MFSICTCVDKKKQIGDRKKKLIRSIYLVNLKYFISFYVNILLIYGDGNF